MNLKFEWLIPFFILGVMLLPKLLSNVPSENLNEIRVILVTCVLVAIVIAVLRYLKKLER